MSEPKVYEILKWQIEQVKKQIQPDGWFMQHDEIRVQGWDFSCEKTKKTPGQILADNARKCVEIIKAVDPGKPIYVWSDMFDPYHNAKKDGRYYLVKGEGPWQGSWEGLPKDVVIVNWHRWNDPEKTRLASMQFFAGRGHRQILADYYDSKPQEVTDWLKEAKPVQGIIGVMYTTWVSNYNDLEAFMAEVKNFARP